MTTIDDLMGEAAKLAAQRDHKGAERLYTDALDAVYFDDPRVMKILNGRGISREMQGYSDSTMFDAARRDFEIVSDLGLLQAVEGRVNIADTYRRKGEREEALAQLAQADQILSNITSAERAAFMRARLFRQEGLVYLATEDNDLGIEPLEESYGILIKLHGESHLDARITEALGNVEELLGTAYAHNGSPEMLQKAYDLQTEAIKRSLAGEDRQKKYNAFLTRARTANKLEEYSAALEDVACGEAVLQPNIEDRNLAPIFLRRAHAYLGLGQEEAQSNLAGFVKVSPKLVDGDRDILKKEFGDVLKFYEASGLQVEDIGQTKALYGL